MTEDQESLPLDDSLPAAPADPPELRAEIARVWSLPLGEQVEVSLRQDSLDTVSGVLELAAAPDFPWDPRQPLRLRVKGFVFDSRNIVRWTCL
jgi:hypothetical protein